VAIVGTATALYAASCALAQRDIKRLLAYSTMSQVGYMFLAVGAGAVSGAMFHLLTHAFFKALLFMAAGGAIHLAAGEQNLFRMGGLARQSPAVFWPMLAGILCLAGVPLTGGFFSKDAILLAAFSRGDLLYRTLAVLGLAAALLTALYSFRLLYLLGPDRKGMRAAGHRLSAGMVWTLAPLALLGLAGGLINLPEAWGGHRLLDRLLAYPASVGGAAAHDTELFLGAATAFLTLIGWLWARWRYTVPTAPGPAKGIDRFFLQGWQADLCIATLLVRPFQALARFWGDPVDAGLGAAWLRAARFCQNCGGLLRRMTTGRLPHYLAAIACGLSGMMIWLLLRTLWP
jgi:NADH-quinone oxidoreductase subunit L